VFEEAMDVPEDERLPGPGWIQSFCHAHKLKEIQKHGEAASVDIKEEQEIGECLDLLDGGDLEIVQMAQAKVGLARGNIEEINSDSNDDNPEAVPPPLKEMIQVCRMLEENSLLVYTEDALDLVQAARQYRGHLQRISREGAKQTTLDMFFNSK
jgi:hypothetical protein